MYFKGFIKISKIFVIFYEFKKLKYIPFGILILTLFNQCLKIEYSPLDTSQPGTAGIFALVAPILVELEENSNAETDANEENPNPENDANEEDSIDEPNTESTETANPGPPVFSPVAGYYTTPTLISITTTLPDSTIYYTRDGSTPDASSTQYTEPIPIWWIAGQPIRAIAINGTDSTPVGVSGVYSYPNVRTGQTASFGANDDGDVEAGVPRSYIGPTQNTTYPNDYTTTDNATGMVWRTCQQGRSGSTCSTGTAQSLDWNTAQNSCDSLNSLNGGNGYAGKTDWRLPSVRELETLVDYGRNTAPWISTSEFPNTATGFYWSATSANATDTNAWRVYFSEFLNTPFPDILGLNSLPKTDNARVRCVSGVGMRLKKVYTDNGDGTVTDNRTRLVWQKCSGGLTNDVNCSGTISNSNWNTARNYCNGLTLAGRSWRLPNARELYGLMDLTQTSNPRIDTAFPATSGFYWSGTSYAPSTGNARILSFGNGASLSVAKSNVGGRVVRCVSDP